MTDFYQSPADKLRFEILLKSLREGRLNLAILGDEELALASYARRIFQHLREQGEPNVELWTSADSERLVERFNEILSSLTLDQALDKSNKTAPKRYMIFPDTHGIQDFELQLLARLVNGFPASNINVILLVNSQSAYDKKLSAFGKNLLQWVLESQTPTTTKTPRLETLGDWPGAKEVVSENKSSISEKPLDIGLSLPAVPPPPLDLSDIRPADSSTSSMSQEPVMGDPVVPSPEILSGEELAKSWEEPKTENLRGGRIAAVLLIALVFTLGISGFIYQERVSEELQGMRAYLAGAKPAATSPPTPASVPPAPPPTVSMSSSNTTAVKPNEALNPAKEELVVNNPEPAKLPVPPPAEVTVKSESVTTPTDASSLTKPKPVKEPVKEPPAKEPAKEPVKESVKEPVKPIAEPAKKPVVEEKPADKLAKAESKTDTKPKSQTKTSDKTNQADNPDWVQALDTNAWVMQHGAFESLSEARNFQSTSLGYQSGQVLYTQRKGSKPYYILITGPYTDKAQAEALMKQNPPLAKAWVRSAKSLKAQFQE